MSAIDASDVRGPGSSQTRSRRIDRRQASDLSYEAFHHEYVMRNRPVVIDGATVAWPAMQKWTPDFFKRRFGSREVQVSIEQRMPFDRFIDAVEASSEDQPGPYMYRLYLAPELPELMADVEPASPYSNPGRLAHPLMPRTFRRPDGYLKLLIGGLGGSFPVMHFDAENHHACVSQLHGEKAFVLYPPEESRYMYPQPEHENRSQIPGRDIHFCDYGRFPLLAKATRYETRLRRGEMIFIPCRWWHTTRVLSTSISVCQNMLDRSNWAGFVRWVTQRRSIPRGARRWVMRAHLTALGMVMSVLEDLPGRA